MSNFLSAFLYVVSSLFPIVDPLGGAMLYWALTRGADDRARARCAGRMFLYSTAVLLVCLYAGNFILNFFGISIGVLRVAGGLVLFSQGWHVLNDPDPDPQQGSSAPMSDARVLSMAFYPITLPLVTGPGAIAVCVAYGANSDQGWGWSFGCILGIVAICAITWACFRFCEKINVAVGVAGANALARIFGFILICLGVAIFWEGFTELWSSLPARGL